MRTAWRNRGVAQVVDNPPSTAKIEGVVGVLEAGRVLVKREGYLTPCMLLVRQRELVRLEICSAKLTSRRFHERRGKKWKV